jgi:hypothetical protein
MIGRRIFGAIRVFPSPLFLDQLHMPVIGVQSTSKKSHRAAELSYSQPPNALNVGF